MEDKPHDVGSAMISWMWPQKQGNKRRDKLDFIDIKNFCLIVESIKNEKTMHRMGGNVCKLYDKGLISKIYYELLKIKKEK